NPDNYPIYLHCSLGRDRAGTLAYLISALVGVELIDLQRDYETSFFSVTGTSAASLSSICSQRQATLLQTPIRIWPPITAEAPLITLSIRVLPSATSVLPELIFPTITHCIAP
ncbi:MAG: tyrosine-protein phosphatase, partial [Clostridia bacterium]|nr:tyrosine-protein phosphatase [Clostridia bacterium]